MDRDTVNNIIYEHTNHKYRTIEKYKKATETIFSKIPKIAEIYLDGLLCNQNCIHCYCYGSPKGFKIPPENILAAKDILEDEGYIVHPQFAELFAGDSDAKISLFHELNKSDITTNGLLIEKHIDLLLELERKNDLDSFSPISISLHGDKESHDLLTGKEGSYKRTLNAIKILYSNHISSAINMVVYSKNYDKLKETVAVLKDYGVQRIILIKMVPSGRAVTLPQSLFLTKEQQLSLIEDVEHLRKVYHNEIYINYIATWGPNFLSRGIYSMELQTHGFEMEMGVGGDRFCNFGIKNIVLFPITPEEFIIYPCHMLITDTFKMGHLNVKTGECTIDTDPYENIHEKVRGPCQTCAFLQICGGGCRASAYTESILSGNPDFYASQEDCLTILYDERNKKR